MERLQCNSWLEFHLDTDHRAEPAEQLRVRELQQEGKLEALYIPDGIGAPGNLCAVLNADSRDALQTIVETLPAVSVHAAGHHPLRSLQAGR